LGERSPGSFAHSGEGLPQFLGRIVGLAAEVQDRAEVVVTEIEARI